MQNFLSHFMFSIFWFNILSILLILGLIFPLYYLFFICCICLLFLLSFCPACYQINYISYYTLSLYFIHVFVLLIVQCFVSELKHACCTPTINNEYSPTSNMMEAINPSSSLQFGLYFFCDHIFTIDIKGSIFFSTSLTLSLSYRELAVYIAFSSPINQLKNW